MNIFFIRSIGGLFNALSYAKNNDKIFLANETLKTKINVLKQEIKIYDNYFVNENYIFLSFLEKNHKYCFEWNSGISTNEVLVYMHLFHSFFTKNKFKLLLCFCFLLKKYIVMFPHGINLYGTTSFNSNKTKFYNTRNFVNKYFVDSKHSRQIASKLFKVEKYKIYSSVYCLNFRNIIFHNNNDVKTNNIIIILPKIRRISKEKLVNLLTILGKYNYEIILLTHPNDIQSSFYNKILNNFKGIFHKLTKSISFIDIQKSKAIIDGGSSFFIIAQYFNERTYRYNLTLFNSLLLDDCFHYRKKELLNLPIFDYNQYKKNYS